MERPVREVVRLFNIEDTFLLEDIANAQKLAMNILDSNQIVPRAQVEKMFDQAQPSTTNLNNLTNFGLSPSLDELFNGDGSAFIQYVLGRVDDDNPVDDFKKPFARMMMHNDEEDPTSRDNSSDFDEMIQELNLGTDRQNVMLL